MKQRSLTHYWQLFAHFRKVHLMRMVEYRNNFFFWGLVSVVWTLFNFFFIDILVGVGGGMGGWTKNEVFVVVGVFTILDAFTWSFFHLNMQAYTQSVFNGELNGLLLKPVDTQFLLMTRMNSYDNIFRFLLGIGMVIRSLHLLNYQPSLMQLIMFVLVMILSFTFLYSLWFILSTFSFYFERLDNINEILPGMRRAWQIPRTVYTGVFSIIFTIILPIGLITSIPAEILLGKTNYWWVVYFTLITITTFFISRWFFYFSVKNYTGVAN